jgi:hypothetical protein
MNKPDLSKIKDKSVLEYIAHLESKLNNYEGTIYSSSYLALKKIVDKGNEQIKNIEIDILTDEGEKQYKLVSKFASQLKEYGEQLEFFRSKMTPDEIKEADTVIIKQSLGKKVGLAEQIALKDNGRNTSV